MKKFIVAISIILVMAIALNTIYYEFGIYIDFNPNEPVNTFVKSEGGSIKMLRGDRWKNYTIKGVNMGSGMPGEWTNDFKIDEDTYYKWFGLMQEMGANTLRIYAIQAPDFYTAFYRYNTEREAQAKEPLWLLHGLWVNDYVQHSHLDAFSDEFKDTFIDDCRTLTDVIHGRKNISLGSKTSMGSGSYRKDISNWVIGYILGVEWERDVVIYTNQLYEGMQPYEGTYMYGAENARPIENLLAEVGDKLLEYETDKYKTQKLIAFSNWPTTDPFKYSASVTKKNGKTAFVDVERIKTTDKCIAGQFASYHIYPYFPDYFDTVYEEKQFLDNGGSYEDWDNNFKYLEYKLEITDAADINDYFSKEDYYDNKGQLNTYYTYLKAINNFHTMPVVVSEFGVSTGRGIARKDKNTGRNQGHMTETEQGYALIECWEDLIEAGSAGGCVFSWQDEWFKRTWNTKPYVNLTRTVYWSDYQTNEQFFGLLSFDPGEEKSVAYVDGDVSEWTKEDISVKTGNSSLSVKYDEKFLYLMIYKKNLDFENEVLYIPFDITPKTGSTYCENNGLKFERECDFLLTVNGKSNSRLQVQQRYESLRAAFGDSAYKINAFEKSNIPDKNTPLFVDINLLLQNVYKVGDNSGISNPEFFETGNLIYGNANPESEDFNSLADFICSGDYVEVKIPWQLLNFSDPSKMEIHDDYYDGNYGVDYISIDEMFVGLSVGNTDNRIMMNGVELEGWGNDITYHERLKSSYYILKNYWTKSGEK